MKLNLRKEQFKSLAQCRMEQAEKNHQSRKETEYILPSLQSIADRVNAEHPVAATSAPTQVQSVWTFRDTVFTIHGGLLLFMSVYMYLKYGFPF